jgi:hypothetical protein
MRIYQKWTFIFVLLITTFFSCIPDRKVENAESSTRKFVYAEEGRLYFPDGKELSLWGVNLQPSLSWEYNSLFKLVGAPLNTDTLKLDTESALDEIIKMNCNVVRVHLTPTDFSDSNGNLVETVYLDQLDYMLSEAEKRGMYSSISLLNPGMAYDIDMEDPPAPSFVEGSFLTGKKSKDIVVDPDMRVKSKTFVQQLLNRTNPYLVKTYKDTESIALWEIVNEPTYFSFEAVVETPYYDAFKSWSSEKGLEETEGNYATYRHGLFLSYINFMYDAVRETGAVHPIVWNCNWHNMIKKHKDVFDAVAKSKVEVVSFCNYLGQNLPKRPYRTNPVDLSRHDFTDHLKQCYTNDNWYKWAVTPEFMKKAKIVYEFETFYNYSGYLFPAIADFQRSMGVQMSTMWHYSMPRYAPYRNGSHHLSYTSTPHKAASYALAGEVFNSLPLYHAYDTARTIEKLTENYMFSYKKDLSIYSSDELYAYSADVSADELPKPSPDVKQIIGFGSSPVVKYEGTGIYRVAISESEISIEIEPNSEQLKPLWGKDFLAGVVTKLDYHTQNEMTLALEGWSSGNCELYRIEEGREERVEFLDDLSFSAVPGRYKITKTK